MDELTMMVALAPFYVMAVVVSGFTVAKLIQAFLDSATETQLKETIPKP